MCGIAGIVYRERHHPVDRRLVQRMTRVQAHRGPDAEGVYFADGVGLGHRRLSIIDLTGGDQPIFNEDRTKAVILNGEIYNFRELREELEAGGHTFRTRSDTEVLVHGYEAWGERCVERLRGMFAFAIWDSTARTLFLGRDRVGKKPLYYAADGERLIFSSELKGLLQDDGLKRAVNLEALDSYLAFGVVPAPSTIFEGIFQLPPAHTLTFRNGHLRLREYWDVQFGPREAKSEPEYLEELAGLLADAVSDRLVSDVPLGAFLSGGVDSSVVVAHMAAPADRSVVTVTAGFREREWDESRYAGAVAHRLRTNHHELRVAPSAADIAPQLVWHFDEPFADSSAIPTYYVCQAARQRVTVALSGDGGDEVFAGYQRRYGMTRFEARIRGRLPEWLRSNVVSRLSRVYPKWEWLPRPLRLKYLLSNLAVPLERAFFHDMSFLFRPEEKERLYSLGSREALAGHDPFAAFAGVFHRVQGRDALTQVLYVDLKTSLPNDMLTKVDRMSMANSLEVRCPLLDHRIIEFAAGLPAELKYRGSTSKYLLKRHLERWLPRQLVYRDKMGFSVPLGRWLRAELRPLVEELLFSATALDRGYFEPRAVRAFWRAHQLGVRDHASRLWGLMMLELWHRTYIDRPPAGPIVV